MKLDDRCLTIPTSGWARPLQGNIRYKGLKGGRGSGKSHFFAEELVLRHISEEHLQSVCIREIQKSLKYSAKRLIETKIREMGVSHLFRITQNEISRVGFDGIIIFQGMQDHTADSIKSLEGFGVAWVEEAQSLSKRSMELLLPTIRAPNSEIWFSWNPDQDNDPVELLKADMKVVHINFTDNAHCPDEIKIEAERHLRTNPETYDHVWLGKYNIVNDAQIFKDKFVLKEFEPLDTWLPVQGLDWGFSQDPSVAVQCYYENNTLYIRRACGRVGLELDHTAQYFMNGIPDFEKYTIRADSARPESVSYCKRTGLPLIQSVKKWAGSVEDGIAFMQSTVNIVIHPDCRGVHDEFRLYSYKIDKRTGDITKVILDTHNHYIDAIRYALQPFISHKSAPKIRSL